MDTSQGNAASAASELTARRIAQHVAATVLGLSLGCLFIFLGFKMVHDVLGLEGDSATNDAGD